MKKTLRLSFIVLSILAVNKTFAQTDSAVWPLVTTLSPTTQASYETPSTYTGGFDSVAYKSSGILADTVVFGNVAGVNTMIGRYSPANPTAVPGFPYPYAEAVGNPKIWHITNIDQGTAGTWPAEATGRTDTGRYFQFNVSAPVGKQLTVTGITIPAAGHSTGNFRLDIYYSTDGFATSTLLDSALVLKKDTLLTSRFSIPNVMVPVGQKFSLRIYPWFQASAAGTTKSLSIENFAIEAGSFLLPVIFTGINAIPSNGVVGVNWSVATESNVSHYVVERSSDDVNFSALPGTVSATGSSNYSYTDASPLSGTAFYRVQEVDDNGSSSYSSTVSVGGTGSNGGIVVSPNPVTNSYFNLAISDLSAGIYTLNIFSNVGQKVYSTSVTYAGGSSSQTITLPASLSKGLYTVQLGNGAVSFTKGIIVE